MLWQLKNIFKAGDGSERLNDVTIEINEGITAVIGPSGAGKTSLLNILSGFEKPDKGKVNKSEMAGTIYWVPQNLGLWEHLSVSDHLECIYSSSERDHTILSMFALDHKKDAYPGQLSKGEQSRLAIARALVSPAQVLVMDEPLVNIAVIDRLPLWSEIIHYAEESSKKLVYATHSPEYVVGSADYAICITDGRIRFNGRVDTLYFKPETKDAAEYLGHINWFDDNSKIFLPEGIPCDKEFGVRPPFIDMSLDPEGACCVMRSRFRGSLTETRLRHKDSGIEKDFFHHGGASLEVGENCTVNIKLD